MAQVRVVFQLPEHVRNHLFPNSSQRPPPEHLAYVEWFTPFSTRRFDENSKTYRVSRSQTADGYPRSRGVYSFGRYSVKRFPGTGILSMFSIAAPSFV